MMKTALTAAATVLTFALGAALFDVKDAQGIAAGGRRYAALCAGCHLAPGVARSDIRPGLQQIAESSSNTAGR